LNAEFLDGDGQAALDVEIAAPQQTNRSVDLRLLAVNQIV
jgi:hypothetical protein